MDIRKENFRGELPSKKLCYKNLEGKCIYGE